MCNGLRINRGRHEMKFGVQSRGAFVHANVPSNFNGAYVFGCGSAQVLDSNNNLTGQTEPIDGMEQYHLTLLALPGGPATTYQLTSGTPLVPLTKWRVGLYGHDTVN